jgi:hypothetical protein
MWPVIVDAVVDVLAAADLGGARVFDGPPPADDATALGVAIGMPTPDGGEDTSGSVEQVWEDAGPAPIAHRKESGVIRCSAWAWTGNDYDFRALRAGVSALLDDVHTALAAIDPLVIPQVTNLQVLDAADWVQRQDERGTTCEAMFRLTYEAVFN